LIIDKEARMSLLVYIITLNWNRAEDTLRLLASCAQLTYPNCRVLIVDNGSKPDCLAQIKAKAGQAEWVCNARNLGFSAGVNTGLRYALAHAADGVLLLNNDTTVAPDLLERLIESSGDPETGAGAPLIYYAHDRTRLWSAGSYFRSLTRDAQRLDLPPAPTPYRVDYATACGLLIKRTCLERVGLFDERFFMYYEDLDFCRRLAAAGYHLVVDPRARLWHTVAATIGGRDSPDERYHMALAGVRFYRKYIHGWRWGIVAPYRLISALKTTGRLWRTGHSASIRPYWRGLRVGLTT
jgi:GT2 family glycosyltransferase